MLDDIDRNTASEIVRELPVEQRVIGRQNASCPTVGWEHEQDRPERNRDNHPGDAVRAFRMLAHRWCLAQFDHNRHDSSMKFNAFVPCVRGEGSLGTDPPTNRRTV